MVEGDERGEGVSNGSKPRREGGRTSGATKPTPPPPHEPDVCKSEADTAPMLALLDVAARTLGPSPLGDGRRVGLLPPLVAYPIPGLRLHGAYGLLNQPGPGSRGKEYYEKPARAMQPGSAGGTATVTYAWLVR